MEDLDQLRPRGTCRSWPKSPTWPTPGFFSTARRAMATRHAMQTPRLRFTRRPDAPPGLSSTSWRTRDRSSVFLLLLGIGIFAWTHPDLATALLLDRCYRDCSGNGPHEQSSRKVQAPRHPASAFTKRRLHASTFLADPERGRILPGPHSGRRRSLSYFVQGPSRRHHHLLRPRLETRLRESHLPEARRFCRQLRPNFADCRRHRIGRSFASAARTSQTRCVRQSSFSRCPCSPDSCAGSLGI